MSEHRANVLNLQILELDEELSERIKKLEDKVAQHMNRLATMASLTARVAKLEARPIVGFDMAPEPDEIVMRVNMSPEMHDALWRVFRTAQDLVEGRNAIRFGELLDYLSIAVQDLKRVQDEEQKKEKP